MFQAPVYWLVIFAIHSKRTKMKKNCFNCKHLEEYSEVDSDGYPVGEGYHCEKQYQKADERGKDIQHEINMERKEYLEKGKVCFEPKQI